MGCAALNLGYKLDHRLCENERNMPRHPTLRLLNLRRDLLQDLNEALAVPLSDDPVEIAFVPARATRQHHEDFLSGRGDVETVSAPVVFHFLAVDQPATHKFLDDRGQARLIAAIGE